MSEYYITERLAERPDLLKYPPHSHAIESFKWGKPSGTSDLVLFPSRGPVLIAVVEAKRALADELGNRNREAHAQVVGQLLKYYGRARQLSVEGIQHLRRALDATERHRHRALSPKLILSGRLTEAQATARIEEGTALRAEQVALHVVVNATTEALTGRLLPICEVLARDHRLLINVWALGAGRHDLVPIWPAPVARALGRRRVKS